MHYNSTTKCHLKIKSLGEQECIFKNGDSKNMTQRTRVLATEADDLCLMQK